MALKHLKRLVAPTSWAILRKAETFITRPHPGAHTITQCMPINVLIKRLGYTNTSRETKKALLAHPAIIDGTPQTDPKAQAGLFDEVIIGQDHYRILLDAKGHIIAAKAPTSEHGFKPCKVTGKTPIRGGKIQVNTSDGRNLIIDNPKQVAVGDTIIVTTPKQSIKEHHKLENGAFIFLTGGKHLGDNGVVTGIKENTIAYKNKTGQEYTTLKDYAFVLGKGKPAITLQ